MNLTKEAIRKIKKNPAIVAKLVAASDKSYPTVMRWIDKNSEQLTTAACLEVICSELKLTQDQVLQHKAA